MGAKRFFYQIQSYDVVRQMVKRGEIDLRFAEKVVKLYRSIHTGITAFWREIEGAFKFVIRYPHEAIEVAGFKFWKDHATVRVRLPSGRTQNYPRSSYRMGELRWQYGPLWGGTLVENLVQAYCRDVFVDGMMQCIRQGLSPVMHVHDSMIHAVKKSLAKRTMRRVQRAMTITPDWCPGLPLDVEGEISDFYK
jgi:DNA polymerase